MKRSTNKTAVFYSNRMNKHPWNKRLFSKTTAVLLSVLLLFSCLPLSMTAGAETPTDDYISIVKELTEYRTATSKTYLRSDGKLESIVTANPIHYQPDGSDTWEEIDQTLSLKTVDGKTVYENTSAPFTVQLPEQVQEDSTVEISHGSHALSIEFLGVQKSASNKLKQQKEKSNAKKRKIMTGAEIALEDLTQTSSIEYADVYSDADLRYDINSSQLKESIILHKKPNKHAAYSYLLRADGLHPVLQSDGSIRIFETKDAEQSQPVFLLPAPYMYDSADVVSYEIETTLEKQEGGYLLTYRPNTEWLREKARVYPVVIDPSIVVNTGIQDTYISDAPNENNTYFGYETDLRVGNSQLDETTYRSYEIFIKFNNISIPAENYVLDSALLMMTPKEWSGNWVTQNLAVLTSTADWKTHLTGTDEEVLTHQNRPPYAGASTIAYAYYTQDTMSNTAQGVEIKSAVEQWLETPDTNYGLTIWSTMAPTSAQDYISFHSSRSEYPPYLSLTYTELVSPTSVTITNRPTDDRLECKISSRTTWNLSATASPTDAVADVTWTSSNTNVAIVDNVGTITVLEVGSTTITATSTLAPDVSDSFVLTTYQIPIETITITNRPENDTLPGNGSYMLSLSYTPENATDATYILSDFWNNLEWTSTNSNVAYMAPNGCIYPFQAGKAVISVRELYYGLASDQFELTVTAPPISSISLNLPPSFTMFVDDTYTLEATISPSNAEGNLVYTSTAPSVASITNQVITAHTEGQTTIRVASASNPEVYSEIALTITDGFDVNEPPNGCIPVGESWQIILNPNEVILDDYDQDGISITDDGYVTVHEAGFYMVRATHRAASYRYINIGFHGVTPIELYGLPEDHTLYVGEIYRDLGMSGYSEVGNLDIFSEDPDIADVYYDALRGFCVEANSPGTTTLQIWDRTTYAAAWIDVTVEHRPVNEVELLFDGELYSVYDDIIMYVGENQRLSLNLIPTNATYDSLAWEVEDPVVALTTYSDRPKLINLEALSVGETWLNIIINGEIAANFQIIVREPTGTIDSRPNAHYLSIGETYTLGYTADPADERATWTSSNTNVATVSNGTITAKATGQTVITLRVAVAAGHIATSSFTLYVGELDLKTAPSNNTVFVDGTYDFNIGNTTGSNDSNYNWQTGNSSVATVNSTGILTGVSAGTAIITAVSKNNSSIYCRFSVKIKKTKSYVFYLYTEIDDFEPQALKWRESLSSQYYGGNSQYIEMITLNSATYFTNQWNNMGDSDYEIGYVIIICHAYPNGFSDMKKSDDSLITTEDIRENFQDKNMVGLITTGCNAGHLDVGYNLGATFAEITSGAPVIAADGTVYYGFENDTAGNSILRLDCRVDQYFSAYVTNNRQIAKGWIVYRNNGISIERIITDHNLTTPQQLIELSNNYASN